MVKLLHERGHKITYATSDYDVEKIKAKHPEYDYVELQDEMSDEKLNHLIKEGPPLKYYHDFWKEKLRTKLV